MISLYRTRLNCESASLRCYPDKVTCSQHSCLSLHHACEEDCSQTRCWVYKTIWMETWSHCSTFFIGIWLLTGPWGCSNDLKMQFPNTCCRLISWALLVKVLSGECHRILCWQVNTGSNNGLVSFLQPAITYANVDSDLYFHMMSLGHKWLTPYISCHPFSRDYISLNHLFHWFCMNYAVLYIIFFINHQMFFISILLHHLMGYSTSKNELRW